MKRPLVDLEAYSRSRKEWIPLYKVLIDTGADMSILPRHISEMLVEDMTTGKRIEIRGIVPYSFLVCYLHKMKFKIDGKVLELPIALADSDDIPCILGRVGGIDIFDALFTKGKEVRISWK